MNREKRNEEHEITNIQGLKEPEEAAEEHQQKSLGEMNRCRTSESWAAASQLACWSFGVLLLKGWSWTIESDDENQKSQKNQISNDRAGAGPLTEAQGSVKERTDPMQKRCWRFCRCQNETRREEGDKKTSKQKLQKRQ